LRDTTEIGTRIMETREGGTKRAGDTLHPPCTACMGAITRVNGYI